MRLLSASQFFSSANSCARKTCEAIKRAAQLKCEEGKQHYASCEIPRAARIRNCNRNRRLKAEATKKQVENSWKKETLFKQATHQAKLKQR